VYIGAHIGIADGLGAATATARAIGCESIQVFAKSPQMWKGPPIPAEAAKEFRDGVHAQGLRAPAVHHGYLLNLANPKDSLIQQSRIAFLDEMDRAELLGADHLIFHPGAHLGSGVDVGVVRVAESLNWALAERPDGKVRLLLENAAGQGTTLGASFAELARILGGVKERKRVGVTIDTCHLFASGVDFRGETLYGRMIDDLERDLGLHEVGAFHLNDARADLGSHLDRHENIGQGLLGLEGFGNFVNDPRWADRAGYLETPLDDHGYGRYEKDLATLRGLRKTPPKTSGAVAASRAKKARRRTR
jgi:deoxyribonuclease-4